MQKTYRVGGCIRDRLLKLPIKDEDWVKTGTTPEEMQSQGFLPIGKDFPVFLHPDSKQEYALARTERKTSPGYTGFQFNTDPSITIEQDLLRRDLTINAIAEDEQGKLIDPYGGQQDIHDRILRHVSPAFSEDPVRVLRVARFAARFHHLGFKLAAETRALIKDMGDSGELDSLVAERVWQEMQKALGENNPQIFFELLRECDVLQVLFPEIDQLFGVPQPAKHHPEIDTGIHVMMALEKSAQLGFDTEIRFAVLMHDLGKANTPKDILPSHHGHEERGVKKVKRFCKNWRSPKTYTELALITCQFHTHIHRIFELKASTLLKLLSQTDYFRRPERFIKMTKACKADSQGRLGHENKPYPQAEYACLIAKEIKGLDLSKLHQKYLGKDLGEQIYQFRLSHLKQLQQKLTPQFSAI